MRRSGNIQLPQTRLTIPIIIRLPVYMCRSEKHKQHLLPLYSRNIKNSSPTYMVLISGEFISLTALNRISTPSTSILFFGKTLNSLYKTQINCRFIVFLVFCFNRTHVLVSSVVFTKLGIFSVQYYMYKCMYKHFKNLKFYIFIITC